MKKNKMGLVLALVLLGMLSWSCSDDDDAQNLSPTPSEVSNIVKQGNWSVTYYFDDTDKTLQFEGYNFTFGEGNVVTADKDESEVLGTWSVTLDDDDDSNDDLEFNLLFVTPATFLEISDDWDIIEYTDTKIRLADDSNGGDSIEYLTFEKN
jgi:hypothetical protein